MREFVFTGAFHFVRPSRGKRWIAAMWSTAALLPLFVTGTIAEAQIPQDVVDNAVQGKMGPSVMLTACKEHTYRHRLRLEEVAIEADEDTLTYSGKIVNVIRGDRNNLMKFSITLQGDAPPNVEIVSVKEREILPKIKDVVRKIIVEVSKEAIESQFASSQSERDRARASVESRFASMDQKDWKTPSQALISAIAVRLYETKRK